MSALRKGWCPGALRPMAAKDGLLVRLRITGGILPAATARAIADLAEAHGNGLFDLSARGNLQLRGVSEASLPALQDGLESLGLLDANAAAESVRNVIASPLAGLHDGLDIRPLVEALEKRLADNATLHALPGKFGFLIDDGSWPTLAGVEADVRFDWGGARFAIALGGTREKAVPIGSCTATGLVDRAGAIAEKAIALMARHPDARRMRHLAAALGPESLAREFQRSASPACGRRWPNEVGSDEGIPSLDFDDGSDGKSPHPTLADARATPDQVRGKLFSRKQEKGLAREIVGLKRLDASALDTRQHRAISCLGIAAPFGRLDVAMLRDAAAVAYRSHLKELRLTPWRALLIPGVERLDKPLSGFITDQYDPRLAIAACVGASGCVRGSTDTHADAVALAGALAADSEIALHVSGCEKGCAKASPTPVTLVARDGRYDLIRNGRAGDRPARRGMDLTAARAAIANALQPA